MDFDNSVDTSTYILPNIIINRNKDHPSNIKIKCEVSFKYYLDNSFSSNIPVTSDEVIKLLNSNEAAGSDTLSIKLNNIGSKIVSKILP